MSEYEINASNALGGMENLTSGFNALKGDGEVHRYKLNEPVTVKLANGEEASVSDISVIDKNGNDAFFAPGEEYKAQGIINRGDTEFSVGKKPLVPGGAETLKMDESTGVIRANKDDVDGSISLPKGSFAVDAEGNKVDLSGATLKVPAGTDAVQMVELDNGSTAFVPLDFDKLEKVDGEEFTDTKKNGDIKRQYTEQTYDDTDGDFKAQYKDLGLSDEKIDKLVEEAAEVKTRIENPTLKDKGLDAINDAADKAIDAAKDIKIQSPVEFNNN